MSIDSIHHGSEEKPPWGKVDDERLIAAMRRGVSAAFAEIYRRHAPLLMRMARRRRTPAAEQETLVAEHLEDTLMPILKGRPMPDHFASYLAAGFRRRLVSAWRARELAAERRRSLTIVSGGAAGREGKAGHDDRERVVAEGFSEYALRSAQGPDPAGGLATRTQTARDALADVLSAAMTPDERRLMGQVAERYPQREIAEGYGVSHATMRVRIHRIRERLMQVAATHIGTLAAEDGILLARLLATPRAHHTPALRSGTYGATHHTTRHRQGPGDGAYE